MISITDRIRLNQLAQGILEIGQGEQCLRSLREADQRLVMFELNFMIANASPRPGDALSAVALSGLKPTYTPCVLIQKGALPEQLAKIVNLPANELLKSFRFLLALLGVSDRRRRIEKPLDTKHWWHRDLSNPTVISEIEREFGSS